jgi:hypothetical protein
VGLSQRVPARICLDVAQQFAVFLVSLVQIVLLLNAALELLLCASPVPFKGIADGRKTGVCFRMGVVQLEGFEGGRLAEAGCLTHLPA